MFLVKGGIKIYFSLHIYAPKVFFFRFCKQVFNPKGIL